MAQETPSPPGPGIRITGIFSPEEDAWLRRVGATLRVSRQEILRRLTQSAMKHGAELATELPPA